jgi:hypothetical protein
VQTLSPTPKRVTLEPMARTVPEASEPGTTGRDRGKGYVPCGVGLEALVVWTSCISYICYHDVAIVERRCFDGDQTVMITDVVGGYNVFLKYQTIDACLRLDFPYWRVKFVHGEIDASTFCSASLSRNTTSTKIVLSIYCGLLLQDTAPLRHL